MATNGSNATVTLSVETLSISDALRRLMDLCERQPVVARRLFPDATIAPLLRRMVTVKVDNLGGNQARAYIEPSEFMWGVLATLEAADAASE